MSFQGPGGGGGSGGVGVGVAGGARACWEAEAGVGVGEADLAHGEEGAPQPARLPAHPLQIPPALHPRQCPLRLAGAVLAQAGRVREARPTQLAEPAILLILVVILLEDPGQFGALRAAACRRRAEDLGRAEWGGGIGEL
jgi:hypothetical protein